MAVRQALRFTKEVAATPGVFDASATLFTNLRMTSPVTDQPKPLMWTIRDAAGSNRRVQTGSAQYENSVKVSTELYISQAALLIPAFCTPTGTGAGLTTFTIDDFTTLDNGTKTFMRRLGMTPQNLSLSANNSGQGVLVKADMTFVGRTFSRAITVTDFPVPSLTDYPSDTPMYFESLAGGVTVATSRTNFSSWSFTVKNDLDMNFDENGYASPKFYGSRDVDWSMDFLYKIATDRTKYEAVTASAASFVLARGGTSITFNCNAANYFTDIQDERPFDKSYRQKVTAACYLDPAAGDDLTCVVDDTP